MNSYNIVLKIVKNNNHPKVCEIYSLINKAIT